jgi:hypothetical protein
MVARLIEGWESSTAIGDYAGKWTAPGAGAVSPAAGRFGNGLRTSAGAHSATRTFDSQATWVVGLAFRISALPSSSFGLFSFLDGAVIHCGVGVADTSGLLIAWRGTVATVLGTAAVAVAPNTWNHVEARVTIGDTGSVVVRLNGATVLTLPSVDTRNAATASANIVRIGSGTAPSVTVDLDDVYVFDATGAANNDLAGDCKVEQVLPSGAGATTAWTPSAGANYACVDEAPPNGDADYVASATAGQTDTYAFGDLSVAGAGTVKAVQATVQARKDDAGSRSLAVVARPGGTDRVGATQAVGDSYALYPQVWDTNPDTAAPWTVADVNAAQFGARLVA